MLSENFSFPPPLSLHNIECDKNPISIPREYCFDNIKDILEINSPLEEEDEKEIPEHEINFIHEERHEQFFFEGKDNSIISNHIDSIKSFNEIENKFIPINFDNSLNFIINSNNVIVPSKPIKLFTVTKESSSILAPKKEFILLNKKRIREGRKRKNDKDNIYSKIKRIFFNTYLINLLNAESINDINGNNFVKFPQCFVKSPTNKRNKIILDMTLLEIIKKCEILFKSEKEEDSSDHKKNLALLERKEIKENERVQKILNKTFIQLYSDYLNSDEFKQNILNRIKEKNGEEYAKKFENLSKNLIKFFSN